MIPEFEAALDTVIDRLDVDNLPAAVALASLPDQVRGYENIKLPRAEAYRAQLAESLRAFP